jgi:hypothetical protein
VDTQGEHAIFRVLDAYNRSNAMNLVALTVLLKWLSARVTDTPDGWTKSRWYLAFFSGIHDPVCLARPLGGSVGQGLEGSRHGLHGLGGDLQVVTGDQPGRIVVGDPDLSRLILPDERLEREIDADA